MKIRILYLVMASALMLFSGAGNDFALAQSPDGPELFISETRYNFGAVHEGEDVRHHFILKNKGASPLSIIDVKTD